MAAIGSKEGLESLRYSLLVRCEPGFIKSRRLSYTLHSGLAVSTIAMFYRIKLVAKQKFRVCWSLSLYFARRFRSSQYTRPTIYFFYRTIEAGVTIMCSCTSALWNSHPATNITRLYARLCSPHTAPDPNPSLHHPPSALPSPPNPNPTPTAVCTWNSAIVPDQVSTASSLSALPPYLHGRKGRDSER